MDRLALDHAWNGNIDIFMLNLFLTIVDRHMYTLSIHRPFLSLLEF
jgi:hypothetical protein